MIEKSTSILYENFLLQLSDAQQQFFCNVHGIIIYHVSLALKQLGSGHRLNEHLGCYLIGAYSPVSILCITSNVNISIIQHVLCILAN